VVGTPLQRKDEAVVVVAEGGGALEVKHIGIRREFGDASATQSSRGPAVDWSV
jgi:hypothetical protein